MRLVHRSNREFLHLHNKAKQIQCRVICHCTDLCPTSSWHCLCMTSSQSIHPWIPLSFRHIELCLRLHSLQRLVKRFQLCLECVPNHPFLQVSMRRNQLHLRVLRQSLDRGTPLTKPTQIPHWCFRLLHSPQSIPFNLLLRANRLSQAVIHLRCLWFPAPIA